MEFSELNDHICADSWLIKSEEISKRRLVRRTARYNIYKADYFGDALVYEPICGDSFSRPSGISLKENQQQQQQQRLDCSRLSARLAELTINLDISNVSPLIEDHSKLAYENSDSFAGSQTDSAYSSISSTPQYHTKKIQSEFEFPAESSSWTSSLSANKSELEDQSNDTIPGSTDLAQLDNQPSSLNLRRRSKRSSSQLPLVLNMGAYQIAGSPTDNSEKPQSAADTVCEHNQMEQANSSSSTWLNELNELRLVAHESFMLFMGFSLENQDTCFQTTSLVMEHPKATSLYNLLHANCAPRSPSERFFAGAANRQVGRQRLELDAKLTICQQVTNAMTYLHDKNIVHGRLTSVNIYIELNQRVKISLIDNDEQALVSCAPDFESSVCPPALRFNLAALTYLSPELIKTIRLTERSSGNELGRANELLVDSSELSKKSDVFSFGTILFELFEERFPFGEPVESSNQSMSPQMFLGSGRTPLAFATNNSLVKHHNINLSASELIYQLGSGLIGAKNLRCSFDGDKRLALVNQIISACWMKDPSERPNFRQLSFANEIINQRDFGRC